MLESFLPVQPKTKPVMYFWWGAAWSPGRLKAGCQKGQQQIEGLQHTLGNLIMNYLLQQ